MFLYVFAAISLAIEIFFIVLLRNRKKGNDRKKVEAAASKSYAALILISVIWLLYCAVCEEKIAGYIWLGIFCFTLIKASIFTLNLNHD